MDNEEKIEFQVRESRIALVVGAASSVFAVFIFIMYLLHPKKEGGGLLLYLPLLLMLVSGVVFCIIYYNKRVTIDEMNMCYVNWMGKKKQFTLDEIGFCKVEIGGGKAVLVLYDLLGDKLCKLDFGMTGMGEFLQYLVDNRVETEWNRERMAKQEKEMLIPELILNETAVCEEEISKCAEAFYKEAEQIFRDWEKRNKRFEAEWEVGFAEYVMEDLERKGRAWERISSLDDVMEKIPENYECVLEAYLKKDGEYVVNRRGEEVSAQIPYLVRCKSYQIGEGTRIRKSAEKIMEKEIRNYLEMLSKELPKHKYRTESLRLRHKLRKSAGLRSQEYRQRECSSSD
jgi:hypothetical protein